MSPLRLVPVRAFFTGTSRFVRTACRLGVTAALTGSAFCLCFLPGSQAIAQTVYRIGVVPQFEPAKLFGVWRPILNDLERRTGMKFDLVGQPAISAFEKAFAAGQFDFAYMNPFHALVAHEQQGYEPLVRDANQLLKGILVVRKDSPINEVSALRGTTIAFPSPNALGASLLMRADLSRVHQINYKPVYVLTHTSVYLNVALGVAAAGGGVKRTLDEQPDEVKDQLRVLYTTREIKPHPVVVHPRVPAEHRVLVRDAFIAMGKSDEGQRLLENIPMKSMAPATLNDYLPLRSWGLKDFYVQPLKAKE